MDKTSLGDRMKEYENVERRYLTRRAPLMIRLDGVHFHSFTKGFEKPYYLAFRQAMWDTALMLCSHIMGAKIAYTQSDEITILVTDDDSLDTQAWFGKNLQKVVSVSASMATYWFNKFAFNAAARYKDGDALSEAAENKIATFDARAFLLPREEVMNCFEWRQQDCTRNAIESLGQANFSHKQLLGKSCNEIQEMLFSEKCINFNDCPTWYKRGVCIVKTPKEIETKDGTTMTRMKWTIDAEIPIFHQEPDYINRFIYHKEI